MVEVEENEFDRPIDLDLDSYAPAQIAADLEARHALYLREAQRLLIEGLVPDPVGLAEGIRSETGRYLCSRPWLAKPGLADAVEEAEATALAALQTLLGGRAAPMAAPKPPPRPVRRLALQPSATIVGNIAVRKKPTEAGLELAWDRDAAVTEWTVRVSARPDPRQEYVEGELVTLPPGTTEFSVDLDDAPRRIQIYGSARDGRLIRRAVVSALTSGNSRSQWKRQSTSS